MNAKRSAFTRGRIAIVDRVDGVVAAMRINALAAPYCVVVPEPWAIIEALKQPAVDRAIVRKWVDNLLALELPGAGATARLRVLLCHLENALGLEHDERAVVALLAQADDDSWASYVTRLEAELRIAIAIAIPITAAAQAADAANAAKEVSP